MAYQFINGGKEEKKKEGKEKREMKRAKVGKDGCRVVKLKRGREKVPMVVTKQT